VAQLIGDEPEQLVVLILEANLCQIDYIVGTGYNYYRKPEVDIPDQ
jgi:hypothetical protein